MSNADQVQLTYAEESAFNDYSSVTDGTRLRFTSESLRQATNTIQSREIVDDRMVSDIVRTSVRGQGDLNFELSWQSYEDFMEYALQSAAWSSNASQISETDCTVTQTSTTMNIAAGAGTPFAALSSLVNQWVSLTAGSTAPSSVNLGVFKLLAVNNSGADIDVHNPSGTNESTKDFVVNCGGQIVNGTTSQSLVIQKNFADLTSPNVYAVYGGNYVSTFSLQAAVDQILTGTFGLTGHSVTSVSSAQFSGTVTASPTSDPMNATDDVTSLWVGASLATSSFTNCSFNLNNNPRERQVVGSLGPESYGFGKFNVSGTLQRYFNANSQLTEYLAHTTSNLALVTQDGDGNGYVFEFPAIKFTSGQRVVGGENTDVIADLAWEAMKDTTEGIMMRIQRIIAAS